LLVAVQEVAVAGTEVHRTETQHQALADKLLPERMQDKTEPTNRVTAVAAEVVVVA
jgi:hypothetical protein